jgi:hypothetical protein
VLRIAVLSSLSLFLAMPAFADEGALSVTAREFELFKAWDEGKDDPRLEKLADKAKMQKIAKTVSASVKDLQAAITKVEPLAGSLKGEHERSIRAQLDQSPLKGRVQGVEVNTDDIAAVAWVNWKCGDARDIDKEAAHAAFSAAQGSKMVKTLAVWCVDDAKAKQFSATIDRTGFEKIDAKAIERFASSRYIHLFVGVKRGPHE